MSTTLSFKRGIDKPEWRYISTALTGSLVGQSFCHDERNASWADPHIWVLQALTYLNKYNPRTDGWNSDPAFTTLGGAIGPGTIAVFCPSHGPTGLVGGSPSTTSFTLATLPNAASVNINALANNGNNIGYRIRVYGNGSGGTGKCEERTIISNTGGTAPVIVVDSAFSFTPQTTDHYEIMAGCVYMLTTGSTAPGYWKAYDIATQTCSGNLSVTNLIATVATDGDAVMLDEQYVPYDQIPGNGMLSGGATYNGAINQAIQATAADGTHITGSGMPATLTTNEYVNFQIRIVECTGVPTSVGQRRKISANGSGATGQFTIYNAWTVNPDSTAKFVVENNNDLIYIGSTTQVTYSYAAGGYAADANWSTAGASGGGTQYANPPAAPGAGNLIIPCYGVEVDASRNTRHSHLIWFKGGASNILYRLDIANGANGTWSSALTVPNNINFSAGTTGAYEPCTNNGRYFYINVNGTIRNLRFDVQRLAFEPWADVRYSPGAAVVGGRCAFWYFRDGATVLPFFVVMGQVTASCFECPIIPN